MDKKNEKPGVLLTTIEVTALYGISFLAATQLVALTDDDDEEDEQLVEDRKSMARALGRRYEIQAKRLIAQTAKKKRKKKVKK